MCHAETINSGLRFARKQHNCSWCGEKIEPKIRYFFWIGLVDGDFGETKMHKECDEAYQKYSEDAWDQCFEMYSQPRGVFDPERF